MYARGRSATGNATVSRSTEEKSKGFLKRNTCIALYPTGIKTNRSQDYENN